jgi:hypothetical protein
MNRNDTIDLLTAISVFDQRTVGEADVDGWFAIVGHLDVRDCAEAVVIHHKMSADRIKPFLVVEGVRRITNDRAERENSEERRRREDERDRKLGLISGDPALGGLPIGGGDGPPVPGAYDVNGAVDRPCPHCKAEEMTPCINPSNGSPRKMPCLGRLKVA